MSARLLIPSFSIFLECSHRSVWRGPQQTNRVIPARGQLPFAGLGVRIEHAERHSLNPSPIDCNLGPQLKGGCDGLLGYKQASARGHVKNVTVLESDIRGLAFINQI